MQSSHKDKKRNCTWSEKHKWCH